jgi:aryl-alcohol dehydrogenase-like predicted oxidoreductase
MIIGTKISPAACYPDVMATHCDASLRRLGTDYVDLYMIHWPFGLHSLRHFTVNEVVLNDHPRLGEALAALDKMQAQGKIRRYGVSNFACPPLQQVLGTGRGVAVNELPYSLLTRAIELEALPLCREAGIGIIAYMTLMQGILTDTYASLDAVPPLHRRTRHFDSKKSPGCRHGEPGLEAETSRVLDAIRQVAQDAGMPMATLALKWVLANPDITCALVGTRSATRLEENARVADDPLPADIVTRLNDITEPLLQALGPGFDYYERSANDRSIGM